MRIRAAVVADIHAYDGNARSNERPSHYDTTAPPAEAAHPLRELCRTVKRSGVTADVLLCCGDMGDRADPTGARQCWSELDNLRAALGATRLIGTAGNHDVDSRHSYNAYDPRSTLQYQLEPAFPVSDRDYGDRYWSRHFIAIEEDEYRIVVLNSAAYHGMVRIRGEEIEFEYEHGRISPATYTQLEGFLQQCEPRGVNVLLTHHHPDEFAGSGWAEAGSSIHGGSDLLKLLGDGPGGSWLLIHGHTHAGQLTYAGGGAYSPVVFGAGSLCAANAKGSNQFYIVEIDTESSKAVGLDVAGTVEAWDLKPNEAWVRASDTGSLPMRAGFGKRQFTMTELEGIVDLVRSQPSGRLDWDELCYAHPWVRYLTPTDLRALARKLSEHGIESDRPPQELQVIQQLGVPIGGS